MKQTLKEAGYSYFKFLGNQTHILKNKETNELEMFVSRTYPHHGWGLKYKNTPLEFCGTYKVS